MRKAFVLFLFALPGCHIIGWEPAPYEEIAGTYEAVVFTSPGPADGRIDLLALGGSLTMRLEDDRTLEGHLIVPEAPFQPVDTTFSGRYRLEGRELTFELRENVPFLRREAVWHPEEHRIETRDLGGFMAAYKIVLERVE